MCSCQRTPPVLFTQGCNLGQLFPVNCHASGLRAIARLHPALRNIGTVFFAERKMVGVTGLEPVTLRLSSACSNQLSYTPRRLRRNFKSEISNLKFKAGGAEETRTPDL